MVRKMWGIYKKKNVKIVQEMWRKYEESKEHTMNVTSVRRIWRIYKKILEKNEKCEELIK